SHIIRSPLSSLSPDSLHSFPLSLLFPLRPARSLPAQSPLHSLFPLLPTRAPLSLTMYLNRSAGYCPSNGTYTPPAFTIPSSPSTIPNPLSTHNPTRTSSPTPLSLRYLPNRFPLSFNSS